MPFRFDVALEPAAKGAWNLILDLEIAPGLAGLVVLDGHPNRVDDIYGKVFLVLEPLCSPLRPPSQ